MAANNIPASDLAEMSADLSDRAERTMDSNPSVRVEPATIEDLPELVELLTDLMELQGDFIPDRNAHERGLALILEQPNRGRIFVLRNDEQIFGMVNLLFTISTALGGLVILMEDFIIHPNHRGQGYGEVLLDYVFEFADKKDFKRITLLTDKIGSEAQNFFSKVGFEYSSMIPMRRLTKPGQEDQAI
ncbi:GNAT family N-acetyltransferase [Oceaniferula flava]|nr:GNAT family N-acetyltransferase [Oceaniferula flavus]